MKYARRWALAALILLCGNIDTAAQRLSVRASASLSASDFDSQGVG